MLINQGQKARALLIFKLTVLEGPEKDHQADAKSYHYIGNEIGKIHCEISNLRIGLLLFNHLAGHGFESAVGSLFEGLSGCLAGALCYLAFMQFTANTTAMM
jgi:hypothetical protein